jgi:hypothetical protein
MQFLHTYYGREYLIIFLDVILVYTTTLPKHELLLKEVFQLLADNHLYLKLSKCSFVQSSLEYLGHVISGACVATDPTKIQAIKTVVRSNYY